MRKRFTLKNLLVFSASFLLLTYSSCKKDNKNSQVTPPVATPTQLGLYEADSSIYKELDIDISQIGSQPVDYSLVFDTGSGGMVIDANGVLPASMITASGFNFTTDSTIVNGITITNQKTTIEYGVDNATLTTVYGNLAYAPVTIGDQNGSIVVKRLPFFLYYKAVDAQGNKLEAHYFDTFGVSPEYDLEFGNGAYITSPFSYFDPGYGLTRGFKMAALGTSNFSYNGTFVPGVLTLGLTSGDLSSSSGFVMSSLRFYQGEGYDPTIPTTVTYLNKSVVTDILFDTGTNGYSYIEDKTAPSTLTQLPLNSQVTLATNSGFNYSYTVSAADNNTYIENPTTSGATFSDVSIEFFLNNEYLLDFTDHKLGLKNN